MIVSLWSGPRNCSTALMYSFSQRSDFNVVDEPLFAHFLNVTGAQRPSRVEVLDTMSTDVDVVQSNWESKKAPRVFLKHMANHLEGIDGDRFSDHHHLFLIRDPRKVIKSYRAHVDEPNETDLCYTHQLQWLERCMANGWPHLVVDSDDLVSAPGVILRQICDFLGIDFQEEMLTWEPGAKPEDGVWAKYWYHRVHASSGWESSKQSNSRSALHIPAEFSGLLAEIEPVFRRLQKYVLTK